MRILDGRFFNTTRNEFTNVYVVKSRGRSQYRMGSPKGELLASGMTPAAFVKRFWMRDDFIEGE